MSLREVLSAETDAIKQNVSSVARSDVGFVREYERAGNALAMKNRLVPNSSQTWGNRRDGFIKRHLAQYQKNPTERRRLALAMWAYRA